MGSDGGVYAYGDAPFEGSAAGLAGHAPVVGMAVTGNGTGYLLAASDGSVFAYGHAVVAGSASGQHLSGKILGIKRVAKGSGYWLVAADGGVFAYAARHSTARWEDHHFTRPSSACQPEPPG